MEDLNKLELPEIKSLCKQYGIGTVGDKKSLIKRLKYYLDPVEDVLNSHPGRKIPKDKQIVGVKADKNAEINPILKAKGVFLYYYLGYSYYMVDKSN